MNKSIFCKVLIHINNSLKHCAYCIYIVYIWEQYNDLSGFWFTEHDYNYYDYEYDDGLCTIYEEDEDITETGILRLFSLLWAEFTGGKNAGAISTCTGV